MLHRALGVKSVCVYLCVCVCVACVVASGLLTMSDDSSQLHYVQGKSFLLSRLGEKERGENK